MIVKPLLKQSHHVIVSDDGDICIGEIPNVSQVIESPPNWVKDVLGKLDGKRTLPRIIKELLHENVGASEDDIYNFIGMLLEANLLQDNSYHSALLSNEEIERYDRQLLQFGLIDRDKVHSYVYQERLKKSKVVVFGMGGWGTWCSLLLAQAGIGCLRIIDGDDVELSNVNRQVLYKAKDVGLQKVNAAQKSIKEFNHNVAVECIDEFATPDKAELERLIGDSTFIVLAWAALGYYRQDTVEEIIHEIAREKNIPIIELGGDPLEISIGPIYPNDGSHKPYSSHNDNERQRFYHQDHDVEKFQKARLKHSFADGDREVNAWQSSPSLAAMAGMACDQIIKFITQYDSTTICGKRIFISLSSFNKREEVVFYCE